MVSADKKIFTRVLISALVCVFSAKSFSQEIPSKNLIKFDPLALFFNTYSIAYERVLTHNSSLETEAGYTNLVLQDEDRFVKVEIYSILPNYRIYTAGKAPKGFFLAPFFSLFPRTE